MKNILLILIFSPIIYLTSCSSGGNDNPQPIVPSLIGEWYQDSSYKIINVNGNIVKTYLDNGERRWFDDDSVGTMIKYITFSGPGSPWEYWNFTLSDSKIYLEFPYHSSAFYTENILNFTNTNLNLLINSSPQKDTVGLYGYWSKVDENPTP